jgi:Rrf2 family iron-sulfur cluster assembly transcriptional regulator
MKLSTKGRFAVNAMIDLALREAAGPVSLAAIAQRQHVSLSYLEQLFSRLRSEDLVQSTRGPGGGYTLARSAHEISVADIFSAVDDAARPYSPDARGMGPSRALWQRLTRVMLEHMAQITLHSLVQEQLAEGVAVAPAPPRRAAAASSRSGTRPMRSMVPNSVFALAGDRSR